MINVTITREGVEAIVVVDNGQPVEIHVAALELLRSLCESTPAIADVEYEQADDDDDDDDVDELVADEEQQEVAEAPSTPKVEHHCDQCERTFPSKASVSAHRRATHSGRLIECGAPGCDFTGGTTNVVAMHRSRMHGPKIATISTPTPPLLDRVGPIDMDAARARAADAL